MKSFLLHLFRRSVVDWARSYLVPLLLPFVCILVNFYHVKSSELKYLFSLIIRSHDIGVAYAISPTHFMPWMFFFSFETNSSLSLFKRWQWIAACVSAGGCLLRMNFINGMGMSHIWQVMGGISGKWPFCEVATTKRKKEENLYPLSKISKKYILFSLDMWVSYSLCMDWKRTSIWCRNEAC